MSARVPLHRLGAELARRAPSEEAPALVWAMIAGAAIAARTRVFDPAQAKTLRIAVPDRTWQAQLSSLAGRYAAGMRQYLPQAGIERVEFVVAPEVFGEHL